MGIISHQDVGQMDIETQKMMLYLQQQKDESLESRSHCEWGDCGTCFKPQDIL